MVLFLEIPGIAVVRDLPVGKQMYDHAAFAGVQFRVNDSIVLNQFDVTLNPKNIQDFYKRNTGAWTEIGKLLLGRLNQ